MCDKVLWTLTILKSIPTIFWRGKYSSIDSFDPYVESSSSSCSSGQVSLFHLGAPSRPGPYRNS
jgi:hypothetical protein